MTVVSLATLVGQYLAFARLTVASSNARCTQARGSIFPRKNSEPSSIQPDIVETGHSEKLITLFVYWIFVYLLISFTQMDIVEYWVAETCNRSSL